MFDLSGFKPVGIDDRKLIESYGLRFQRQGCEFNFHNMFNWSAVYNYAWKLYHERMIVTLLDGDSIIFPAGEYLMPEELADISDTFRAAGRKGVIFDVPLSYLAAFPDVEDYFLISTSEDDWDYIYLTGKLNSLSGPKLRKKRNHISQFIKEYRDWQLLPLGHDPKLLAGVESFVNRLAADTDMRDLLDGDYQALSTALKFFHELDMEGVVLRVAGSVVAFSLFSRQTEDTWTVHFEKSDKHVPGAAQMIAQGAASHLLGRCTYINREQDLGIPGLRHSKHSYDPEFLLKTYTLERRNS